MLPGGRGGEAKLRSAHNCCLPGAYVIQTKRGALASFMLSHQSCPLVTHQCFKK